MFGTSLTFNASMRATGLSNGKFASELRVKMKSTEKIKLLKIVPEQIRKL